MNLDESFCGPSTLHWLGCDSYGQDLALLIVQGMGRSVLVALLVVALKLAIALPMGTVLAWAPQLLRRVCLRLIDAILAFPGILLAILFAALMEPGLGALVITLAITGWAAPTRLVQSLLRQNLNQPYVEAAQASGAGIVGLHWRTLYPALWGQLALYAVQALAAASLAEAALCFLGLGGAPGTVSLGHLIAEGRNYLVEHPRLSLAPGMALFALILTLNIADERVRRRYILTSR
jgi:peptide/nickel transport system permease protein